MNEIVEKSKYLARRKAALDTEKNTAICNSDNSLKQQIYTKEVEKRKINLVPEWLKGLTIAGVCIAAFLTLMSWGISRNSDYLGFFSEGYLELMAIVLLPTIILNVAIRWVNHDKMNSIDNAIRNLTEEMKNCRRKFENEYQQKYDLEAEKYKKGVADEFRVLSADRNYDRLISDIADEFSYRIVRTDRFDYLAEFCVDFGFSVMSGEIKFDGGGEYDLWKHHYNSFNTLERRTAMAIVIGRGVQAEIIRKFQKDPNGKANSSIPDVTLTRCDEHVNLCYRAKNPYFIQPY